MAYVFTEHYRGSGRLSSYNFMYDEDFEARRPVNAEDWHYLLDEFLEQWIDENEMMLERQRCF